MVGEQQHAAAVWLIILLRRPDVQLDSSSASATRRGPEPCRRRVKRVLQAHASTHSRRGGGGGACPSDGGACPSDDAGTVGPKGG